MNAQTDISVTVHATTKVVESVREDALTLLPYRIEYDDGLTLLVRVYASSLSENRNIEGFMLFASWVPGLADYIANKLIDLGINIEEVEIF